MIITAFRAGHLVLLLGLLLLAALSAAEGELAGFRFLHPRLPAPSAADGRRLAEPLPPVDQHAVAGVAEFYPAILRAYLHPDGKTIDRLVGRLLALRYQGRGHRQAMPIALAYDWLYGRLSGDQRRRLQAKLAEGCRYLHDYIERAALSPYNVYLYNSPLQALTASAIALYGDHPQGASCLRFARRLWRERVLPVWRQVMGKHGGWHEGGEYVGIGIGRAVYSVPAMWRQATGEDLFSQEPGLRGFLDFLIYRRRPDGFHLRWGDAGYFDRWVPERYALALEYRNAAAYTLFGCPRRLRPTAWPWGPLPDDSLCDPAAVESLPLQKHFDGIGMVIARSDWSQDATYVTFKAGDNYWSHSHLDQGSFTLYKGGPLIIDSGLYGPRYGSDHHFNYTYQTIAHNVVTVTDPDDTAPMPGKDRQPPRPIANDGGQRRVGSGWGKRAPVDLQEWREHYETYHTGHIARYYTGDDLVVAVAELTPAYTNSRCGAGNFFDRTCRVERYWCTFIYDRRTDVVVIHDDVTATEPQFRKRFLLHMIERPHLEKQGFRVEIPPKPPLKRRGGQVTVQVLFPREAYLNAVGGPGFEFWVDGRNYDENGEVWRKVAARHEPRPEPGRWRVEIVPPVAQERDRFLVAILPSLRGKTHPARVVSFQEGDDYGCRIVGRRPLTLRFPADRPGVRIGLGSRTLDLTVNPR